MKQSLGLLEVSGLALAINCADVMAKAASITLVGLEKTNGSGWMLIRIAGDVASVQSAIASGAGFARQHNGLVAQVVIARPAAGIAPQAPAARPASPEAEPAAPSPPDEEPAELSSLEAAPLALSPPSDIASDAGAAQASCNLCLDPACPRQKGEPRSRCIHQPSRGH